MKYLLEAILGLLSGGKRTSIGGMLLEQWRTSAELIYFTPPQSNFVVKPSGANHEESLV